MRVGVVGCGYWGSKHVRVLGSLPEVESVVAIDSDESRRDAMTARFADRGFPDLTSALSSVDAVVVAVPPELHRSVAAEAMAAGKHVLVEKPLATTTADARFLVDMAARAGVILMVGHTFEYTAAIGELRSMVESGDLGDIQYIDAAWLNLGLYQDNVNVLWDLAPHGISIANFLLNSHPSRVGAWGAGHANGGGHEDVAMLQLQYDKPRVNAYIRVSWLDPAKVRRVTVVGSQRMAVFNDLAHAEPLRIYDRGVEAETGSDYGPATLTYRYGDIVSPYVAPSEPLTVELKHFVESISNDTTPRSHGHSGLAVVSALEASDRALATGTMVDVPPAVALVPTHTTPEVADEVAQEAAR